jgi:hypothetical protein
MARIQLLCLALGLSLGCPPLTLAAWSPYGNPVDTSGTDVHPIVTYNEIFGGAYFIWQAGAPPRIYVQRLTEDGTIPSQDGGWSLAQPLQVSTAIGNQQFPVSAPDNQGGVFIVWQQVTGGQFDLYAQRVSTFRGRMFGPEGIALCARPLAQIAPAMAPGNINEALVVWEDQRNGQSDIYAQKLVAVSADSVRFAWLPVDGVPLCNVTGSHRAPVVVSDGKGGAIAVWEDERIAGEINLYAQRVDVDGNLQWGAPLLSGKPVETATCEQLDPAVVSDGRGGAIVTWVDRRKCVSDPDADTDIYAARVDSNGVIAWTKAVCIATGNQRAPAIVSDGAMGAIIAWQDGRNGSDDIYCQRLDSNGNPSSGWPATNAVVCDAPNSQQDPRMVSDGANGALITWQDARSGENNVYLQRVGPNGQLAAGWANGVRLCTLQASQDVPELARTSDGGVIVGWEDGRGGPAAVQVYAQKQALPALTAVEEGPPARMMPAHPNPFVSGAQIELVLAAPQEVMVEVLDLSGRRVCTLARGLLPAGTRVFTWDGRTERGTEAPIGLYFARARGASFELRVKLVRLR